MAMEINEQLIFTNIILDSVFTTAERKGVVPHSIYDILSGKISSGYHAKIYLEKVSLASGNGDFKISIDKTDKENFFIVSVKKNIISKLIKYDGDKQWIFYRNPALLMLQEGNATHCSFSQKILNQAFQTIDLFPALASQEIKVVDVIVLSVRREQNSTIVFFKLHNDKEVMLLSYTNGIVTGNNNFQLEGNHYTELWGIHTARYCNSFFLHDLFIMNQMKTGFYCVFFPSGLIKNYVDSRNGIWSKQKVWNSEGEFEAEYTYPPGENVNKVDVKDFFPNWSIYIDGVKNFRYSKGEYWDIKTTSPRFSGFFNTFQEGSYGIVFFFSKNKTLLVHKFYQIFKQKKKYCTSHKNLVFAKTDKSFPRIKDIYTITRDGKYLEVGFKTDDMIIILTPENNGSKHISNVIQKIIYAYKKRK